MKHHFFLLLLSIFALYYALNFSINLLFFSFVALETFLVLLDMIQYHVQFSSVGIMFSSVQLLSCVQLFATPWTAALQASLSFTISQSLPKFTSIKSISDAIQLSYLLPLPSPFAFSLSQHQDLFQWVSVCIRWPKYWSFCIVLSMSFQGWFPLGLTVLTSVLSKGLSIVFSITTVQKHQFFGAQSSLWSHSQIYTGLLEKP